MTVLLALLLLGTAAAGLLAVPATPAQAASTGEFVDRLAFRLSSVEPVVLTGDGRRSVTLVGRYTNTGDDAIDDISFRFQRGDALATDAAIRAQVSDPKEPITVVNSDFRPLPGEVAPGGSAAFAVTVDAFGDATDSLTITAPGVYPVMLNVNGMVHRNGGQQPARVGELHLLVTVASVPADVAAPGAVGTVPARPVSILWPLADRPHLGVGGLFADDGLAAEIAPGGRLHSALAAVAGADASGADPDLVTLLVDPMLLDEVQQMANGYRVLAPGSAQPALPKPAATTAPAPTDTETTAPETTESGTEGGTDSGSSTDSESGTEDTTVDGASTSAPISAPTSAPTSTATTLDPSDTQAPQGPEIAPSTRTVEGTGQADAAAFLDSLRALAAIHPVALLPYGDADLAALTRAGILGQAGYAVTHGRDVATRVLVRGPDATAILGNLVTNLSVPVGGELTDTEWTLLNESDVTGAVLAPGGVTPGGAGSSGKPPTAGVFGIIAADQPPGDPRTSGRAVLTGGGWSQAFGAILSGQVGAQPDDDDPARAINLLAARLQVAPAASRTPIVVLPDRGFTPSRTGLMSLSALVEELSPSDTLKAETVEEVLERADAPQPATLNYSAANKALELPLRYLQRLTAARDRIDLLGRALSAADGGPEPREVLNPLSAALLPATSAAWRGVADPAAGQLRTIESTLAWMYGGVQLGRDTGSYTLASSTAPLLLTVRTTLPYQVSIRVQLIAGEQAGIRATDPGLVTIGAGPRSVPIKLDTEVSRSGTFTVYAQLSGPAGVQWSNAVPLIIDSRAYGALTVILMAVAGGVLVIMVVWRLVQRVRGHGRSPADALVEDEPEGTDDAAHDDTPGEHTDATADPAEPSHSSMQETTPPEGADAKPPTDEVTP